MCIIALADCQILLDRVYASAADSQVQSWPSRPPRLPSPIGRARTEIRSRLGQRQYRVRYSDDISGRANFLGSKKTAYPRTRSDYLDFRPLNHFCRAPCHSWVSDHQRAQAPKAQARETDRGRIVQKRERKDGQELAGLFCRS